MATMDKSIAMTDHFHSCASATALYYIIKFCRVEDVWVEDDEEDDFHGVKSTSSDAET